jgi:osmoprotectant transport system ATP-binding protein
MTRYSAIRFEGVTKRFDGRSQPALDGVDLSVEPREFVVIVGASGSGKTTLLQLINRLSEPTGGSLTIGGTAATALDPIELRRRTGYVFQEVGLFPHMSVAENIAITPKLLGWEAARIDARVGGLLGLVRLGADYGSRFPAQLSGGERQRVGVARALAAEPEVVLMDEPFSALDPLTRDALAQDYRRLHDELQLTSVMITHDMLEALAVADRIVVLQSGRIVADGTPKSLIEHEHAYVRELMQSPRKVAERVAALLDTGGR